MTNDDLPGILAGIATQDERRLLRQLRDEAATLTLMVRLENEKRKDEWKKREEKALAEARELAGNPLGEAASEPLTDQQIGGLWA